MSKASDEANLLWPYLLKKIERVVAGNGGSGSSGSVGIGGAPSPHALDSVHHTGALSDAQAPQFLLMNGTRNLTGDLAVDTGITIDGVDLSAHVADPDAHHDRATVGNTGLSITGQQLSLNLATSSGLAISSGVKVDRAAAFAWTGIHSWTQDLQVDADLDFIGAQQITTSAGNLTLNPFSDLILPSTKTDRSSDYADGIPIAGYSFHINSGSHRQLTTHTIKADELHVRVFIADTVRVDVGEEYWGKSMGLVYADFTTPGSIGGTVTVTFEDSVALTGAIFANTDWIMISTVDIGTGLEVNQIWGQVSTYTDLGADVNGVGRQSWVFTLRSGPTSWPVKKGRLAVDFGVSGQGYVHLSTLDSADGPWIQIGTWAGANPYTAGNRTIRTQIGNLSSISDPDFTPTGYGLYSENAYLHGVVRTAETVMDDAGLALLYSAIASSIDPGSHALLSWWPDVDARTGNPAARVAAWQDTTTLGVYVDHLSIQARKSASSVASVIFLDAIDGSGGSSVFIDSRNVIAVRTGTLQMTAHIIPEAGSDITYDLGSASLRWRTVYADQLIVTGAISGATIGGATWSYPGSMVIDAKLATDTLVSITNSLAGRADLAVDRDITLGGTVDGVDISAHAANANAHHNQSHVLATGTALGGDHTISGAAVGEVLRALSATTAAFDVLQHSDLGGISANQHHNQAHVLATGTALGADHTISGANVGEVLRALSATTAAFDVLQHDDLGGVTANQHHNQSHVLATGTALGADHTISGAAAGEVLRALSATTAAFDVLQHADLGGVSADQHHNQVHSMTGSDHTYSGGAALDVFGLSAASTIAKLTPSFDVGTTPVAALLKSTAAGGLTLATMTVRGNVDIINGGDFTVGANVLFVDNSLASVGIDRAPDPQFALDVNGPIRGTEIVGKHAIQLQDVALLLHFDGGEPYASNYTGEPNAIPNGQVPSTNQNIIYRPGKFYKAAVMGAAATNLCANPSFETNTTGWAIVNGSGGDLAVTRDTTVSYFGTSSAKLTWATVNSSQFNHAAVASSSIADYSFGVWMKCATPTTVRLEVRRNGGGNALYGTLDVSVTEEWGFFAVTGSVVTAAIPLNFLIRPQVSGANTLWVDGVCVVQASSPTAYIDGSLGDGYAWSGTAHASTSTRASGRLVYRLEDMAVHRWALMTWFWQPFAIPGSGVSGNIIQLILGAYSVGVQSSTGGTAGLRFSNVTPSGSSSGALVAGGVTAGQWHHLAISYTPGALRFDVDGVTVITRTETFTDVPSSVNVGFFTGPTYGEAMIDDLVVSRQALTANRVRAIYESDAPVFAESSVFHFRATAAGLVSADEEGLWMRDVNGDAVLGAYGGEAATKSWGGFTMEKGDIVFGRYGASDGGWLDFDRNGVSSNPFLSLGYADKTVLALDSGGASLTGVLDIDTNGGIYQGSGSFASPTTGLKVWNASGIGRIAGYNTGVAQWYADTDGKLYAGGGNVVLDASGIAVAITSASAGAANSYNFTSSGVRTAYISGQDAAGIRQINMTLLSGASKDAGIYLDVQAPSAHNAFISLQSIVNSVSSGRILVGRQIGSEPTQVEVTRNLHVNQDSTTLAQPTLQLTQSDLSEEFIAFVSTIGTGNSIEAKAAKVFTNTHFVRVSLNGSMYYMQVGTIA